ncbi:DUF1559 domain-containing protein [Lacipirellula parvula]|uniref:DUF1559 domain-containing protein n=1 Tax=Lacipirellula parvula TaxID=2650471 RepID=A0A5K7X9Z0_9BACT|nr:DUF1559 domain-containing protein [Lacipirellula parvula]BBO32707.1 hypothetical protein PLANPX_2319 [Lacipirellula parvula]
MLLTTTAVAFIVFGFHSVWVSGRLRATSNHITNSMKQIGLGLSNYADTQDTGVANHSVDDAGAPLNSWRWLITPFVAQLDSNMDWSYHESWQSPANRDLREMHFDVYCLAPSTSDCNTNIFAIVGDDTAISPNPAAHWSELPADVLILMEVANSGKNWMEPGDYDVDELLAQSGRLGSSVKGLLNDRIHVMFADGQVWAISSDAPMTVLHPFLTITGAKNADRNELLSAWRVN